jgi:hypothetical protein
MSGEKWVNATGRKILSDNIEKGHDYEK